MAMGYSEIGPCGVSAKSVGAIQRAPSPVDEINSTLESARNLAAAVQAAVNDICGVMPESCEANGKNTPNGIIHAMAARSNEVDSEISEAHGALTRLRSAFGI